MTLYEKLTQKTDKFFLMAGPCIIENGEMPFEIAEKLLQITKKFDIPFIFKASYRKANRTDLNSFTGIGDDKALGILKQIKDKYNLPVVTDIHSASEAVKAAEYVDILQIPAFLCRQTDIIVEAAKTGKIINVKKGQFLSGESMRFVCEKIRQSGNTQILLTDRGTFFGYQDLVVDVRNIPIMQQNNVPVVMDITHSLQRPNQISGVSGGNPQMIETIAKAALAAGADGIFMETHPDCSNARSDGKNMLPLDKAEKLIEKMAILKKTVFRIDSL